LLNLLHKKVDYKAGFSGGKKNQQNISKIREKE
jgi:hypothetical protein